MNKFKIGWIINGCLAGIAIAIAFIFPNPAIILPVFAWSALIGTIQSVFTIAETKEERELRKIRQQISNIPSVEEYKPNTQTYQNLHTNSNSARFKGEHNRLLDNRKSTINKQEVKKCKSEITKEKVISVSKSSTLDLAKSGTSQMKKDDYKMADKNSTFEK